MSRKSQSQKKRHTKPCKFFQMNRCPHPADVCDFAHVIMSPITPTSTDGFTGICRYYYSGTCMNGALCKYQHGPEVPHIKPVELVAPTECVVDWAGMPPEPAYPDSPPLYGNYLPYGQGWPTSAYVLNGSLPRPADSILFTPPRSRDSIDTMSTSTSSLGSDDLAVVTEDPKYNEHSHPHQSQVCVADDAPVIHVSPLHPLLYANTTGTHTPNSGYDYAYMAGLGIKPGRSKSRTGGSKSSLKQKALKYKTKPCKFFNTEKGCPNGSACTFLHDEQISGSQSLAAQRLAATRSTVAKEEARKNFVPIPWRVIGGGVLIGMKKDDPSDEKSSDPDYPYSSHTLPSKPNLPPLKMMSRQRSNSIPPTPSISQVKVEHLFSAESPGVL